MATRKNKIDYINYLMDQNGICTLAVELSKNGIEELPNKLIDHIYNHMKKHYEKLAHK